MAAPSLGVSNSTSPTRPDAHHAPGSNDPIATDYAYASSATSLVHERAPSPPKSRNGGVVEVPTNESGQLDARAVLEAPVFAASESEFSTPEDALSHMDDPHDRKDSDTDSTASGCGPYGGTDVLDWPSLRATHLLLLLPLTFVLAPLFALLPIFAWPPDSQGDLPPPEETPADQIGIYPRGPEWIAVGLGAVAFLAVKATRNPLVGGIQALSLSLTALGKPEPSKLWTSGADKERPSRTGALLGIFETTVPLLGGTAWTELIRLFALYVLVRVALPLPSASPSPSPPTTSILGTATPPPVAFPSASLASSPSSTPTSFVSPYHISTMTRMTYTISIIDVIFFNSLWLALGWAWAESIVVGCFEWAHQVLLYRDVLGAPISGFLDPEGGAGLGLGEEVSRVRDRSAEREEGEDDETPTHSAIGIGERLHSAFESTVTVRQKPHDHEREALLHHHLEDGSTHPSRSPGKQKACGADEDELSESEESQIDELVFSSAARSRERQALEAGLGAPLWAVPWFVVLVWRVDAILLTLATTLFLSLPLLPDSAWTSPSPSSSEASTPSIPLPATALNLALAPTFVVVWLLRTLITLVWTSCLRRWGIVGVSYGTLMLGLGAFLGGLAVWGGLE